MLNFTSFLEDNLVLRNSIFSGLKTKQNGILKNPNKTEKNPKPTQKSATPTKIIKNPIYFSL